MLFCSIAEKVSALYDVNTISVNLNAEIKNLRFVDGTENKFSENTLYFCFATDKHVKPQNLVIAEKSDNCDIETNVIFTKKEDMFAIFNYIHSLLIEENNDFFKEIRDVARCASDFDQVLDIAAVKFNNPLILLDAECKVIAHSKVFKIKDELWQKIINQGFCNYKMKNAIENAESFFDDSIRSKAHTGKVCDHTKTPTIYSKIYRGTAYWGMIIVLEERSVIMPFHYKILPTMSEILENLAFRLSTVSHSDTELYNLLVGATTAEVNTMKFTLDKNENFYLIAGRRELKSENDDMDLHNIIKEKFPSVLWARHMGFDVFLIRITKNEEQSLEYVHVFEEIAKTNNLCLAISNSFKDINSVKKVFEQVVFALRANYNIEKQNKFFVSYTKYQLAFLLHELAFNNAENINVKDFVHPALITLYNYDKINNTEFYDTLKAYLNCSQSIKEASQRLFVHRNTVIYRLERISEICKLNLDDSEQRFMLRISYLIMEYWKSGIFEPIW